MRDAKTPRVENSPVQGSPLITGSTNRDDDTTSRWFKRVAIFAIFGYVLFDRAFAWVHIPGIPVFTGEIVLLLAVMVLLRHQRDTGLLLRQSPLMKVAGLLFVWGVLRLAFDLPVWGISALRDGAQTNYILVGMAAGVIVFRDPSVVERLSRLRRWIPAVVVLWVPVAIILSRLYGSRAPLIPGSETSILSFKPGDYALFAAAAIAYVWLAADHYSSRYRNTITLLGVVGLLVAASQNRGGLLGALVTLALAALFMDRARRRRFLSGFALATGGLVLFLALTNLVVPLGSRTFSAGQLAASTLSVVGGSQDSGLQGTVSWRLDFWESVVRDVGSGDQWLTGIGYGTNLADVFGFQTGPRGSLQPLRNVHNSHVTLGARLGLIGFFLWLALWLQIGLRLNRRDRRRIAPISGWLIAIMMGIGVAAVFDPILEGPQIAIPFWFAAGALAGVINRQSVIGRRRVATLEQLPLHSEG